MDKIVPAFEVSLLEPVFSATLDICEVGIDSLLDDGIFKEIPIVNMVIGIGKTAQNIHERNLLQQTLNFIKSFNEKSINEEKLKKYREKIDKNKKIAEKELGRVLIILNSNVETKKSQLLGKVFRAYVDEIIDWNQFCDLSEAISRLFISDINLIYNIWKHKINDSNNCLNYQIDRLVSIGFIGTTTKSMTIGSNNTSNTERYLNITEFGELFSEIIF
ncbi:MAG: hypothetical protein MR510_02785 [Clostridium sp.]|nr:hypothetical protein [Clostridium sp.]